MTADAPDNEELFTRLVAAYGDALVAGRDLDPDSDPHVPDALRPRLRRVLYGLRLVHAARPGADTPAAPSTGPSQGEQPPTVDGTKPLPTDLGGAAGQRFGRFEIRGALGSGGFANVWLAFDPLASRLVALKVPQAKALCEPELCERFLRDGRAAAGLDHPNLVPVYEVGEVDGVPYIVLSYCPGGTLAEWLRQQSAPVPPATAARLILRLAEAVQYVHEHNIWHRDIKPSNVLLSPATAADELPFTPRLSDFGLALLAERLEVTRSGLAGTPAYMAPEQTGGRVREIGPHTDVYGLGALLYQVLTNWPPFEGGPADEGTPQWMQEVLRKVHEEDPVPPRRLQKDVPRDLETVCLKCLRKEPKKRYATAQELADDLRRFLNGEPIRARPQGPLEKLERAVRKRPRRSAAAGLLLLALAAGLGAGYYFDPERPRRELAAALQKGRRYEFRGDERLPGPFRQVLGDPSTLTRRPGEKWFAIETINTCLWELTPNPGCQRYRLSGEVLHDNTVNDSLVGFYFGYREQRTAGGDRHGSFCTMQFADAGQLANLERGADGKRVSRARVELYLFREQAGAFRFDQTPATAGVAFRPAIAGADTPQWRPLAVEVTPQGVTTYWADPGGVPRPAEEVTAAQLNIDLRRMKALRPWSAAPPADHRPSTGIGLYVYNGRASFRNLVVQPLPGGD
jgi:hypothetical protein